MPIFLQALVAMAITCHSTWYTHFKVGHIPQSLARKAVRGLIIAGACCFGLYFAMDDSKHAYNDKWISEVSIGYPFAISRYVRYDDGVSEDMLSPFPTAVRLLNFSVGVGVIHAVAALLLYLSNLKDPAKVALASLKKKKKAVSPESAGGDSKT